MSTTTTAIATLADVKGTFTLDASHSRIGFVTRHAMVTKVRGAFNDVTGTATVDGSNPNDSSLSVEIAAASIDTRDAGRDGHLVSHLRGEQLRGHRARHPRGDRRPDDQGHHQDHHHPLHLRRCRR